MNQRLEHFYRTLSGKRISLLGLGRTHRPLIPLFLSKGAAVLLRDKRTREQIGEEECRNLEAMGVSLKLGEGYPAIMNPAPLCQKVRRAVSSRELAEPSMTTEDFSWYQQYLPGMFFFLGLGDTPALHADTFDFDETILEKGADFFQKLAENFL